jgi:C_GCAxxG_C_C family probable redox protein
MAYLLIKTITAASQIEKHDWKFCIFNVKINILNFTKGCFIMQMKKEVSVQKIKKEAEELFRGGFFCSEAVVSSIRDNFELDVPDLVIAMASGFPVGIGRSKCVCGAVSGGVMSLGLFFGRTRQGDPKVEKNLLLANELHDYFKTANGKNSLCCRVLTKEFDMASGEHKEQCIAFTGLVAEKVAQIVIREFDLVNIDELVTAG